jgi:hypothetical protein
MWGIYSIIPTQSKFVCEVGVGWHLQDIDMCMLYNSNMFLSCNYMETMLVVTESGRLPNQVSRCQVMSCCLLLLFSYCVCNAEKLQFRGYRSGYRIIEGNVTYDIKCYQCLSLSLLYIEKFLFKWWQKLQLWYPLNSDLIHVSECVCVYGSLAHLWGYGMMRYEERYGTMENYWICIAYQNMWHIS